MNDQTITKKNRTNKFKQIMEVKKSEVIHFSFSMWMNKEEISDLNSIYRFFFYVLLVSLYEEEINTTGHVTAIPFFLFLFRTVKKKKKGIGQISFDVNRNTKNIYIEIIIAFGEKKITTMVSYWR